MIDSSMEEFGRVKEILRQQNIPCAVKTAKSRSVVGRSMDVNTYKSFNISYGPHNDHASFVYYIYVKGKDFDRAKSLAYGVNEKYWI